MPAKPIDHLKKLTNVFNEDDGVATQWLVIRYVPGKNETIDMTARNVLKQMREFELEARIHFKEFVMDVFWEYDADDIICDYYDLLDEYRKVQAQERRNASNKDKGAASNAKDGPKKPKGPKPPGPKK